MKYSNEIHIEHECGAKVSEVAQCKEQECEEIGEFCRKYVTLLIEKINFTHNTNGKCHSYAPVHSKIY